MFRNRFLSFAICLVLMGLTTPAVNPDAVAPDPTSTPWPKESRRRQPLCFLRAVFFPPISFFSC